MEIKLKLIKSKWTIYGVSMKFDEKRAESLSMFKNDFSLLESELKFNGEQGKSLILIWDRNAYVNRNKRFD